MPEAAAASKSADEDLNADRVQSSQWTRLFSNMNEDSLQE
jgi:hypothetical protein